MRIGDCRKNEVVCYRTARPEGTNTQLNVNGPFQLGGVSFNPTTLQKSMNWASVPTRSPFLGCIANLSFNGEVWIVVYLFIHVFHTCLLFSTLTWENRAILPSMLVRVTRFHCQLKLVWVSTTTSSLFFSSAYWS